MERKRGFQPKRLLVAALVVYALMSIGACDAGTGANVDRDNGSDTESGNPGNASGIAFSIDDESYFIDNSATGAGYDPASDETCIVSAMHLSSVLFHVYLPGMSTGVYSDPPLPSRYDGRPYIGVMPYGLAHYYHWRDDDDSFTITVTSYGGVGDRIEGTFSAVLSRELVPGDLVPPDPPEAITISDGAFSVTRHY